MTQDAFNAATSVKDYYGMQGKVALVTGASSGLGRHMARVLASAGCTVGLAARRADRLQELANDIAAEGGRAIVLPLDVTDRLAVESAVQSLIDQAGNIDVLINNAGMAVAQRFLDTSEQELLDVTQVNQTAVWHTAQIVCKHMQESGQGGSVVMIASVAGLRTLGRAACYSMTKAAVVQLTQIMAMELSRYNIRVNAIAPGYIKTEMNEEFLDSEAGKTLVNRSPMRRCGEFSELDGAMLLLSSELGSFITGAVLPVDGGHLVSSL